MSALQDMIARLEAIPGGTRSTAADLYRLIGWEVTAGHKRLGFAIKEPGRSHWESLPDAARRVEEAERFFAIALRGKEAWLGYTKGFAYCTATILFEGAREIEGRADTVPLAICAAVMRAIEAEAGR